MSVTTFNSYASYALQIIPSIPPCIAFPKTCAFSFVASAAINIAVKITEAQEHDNCLSDNSKKNLNLWSVQSHLSKSFMQISENSLLSGTIDLAFTGVGAKYYHTWSNILIAPTTSRWQQITTKILGMIWAVDSGISLGSSIVHLANDGYCSFTDGQREQSKPYRASIQKSLNAFFNPIEKSGLKKDFYQFKKSFFDEFLERFDFDLQNLPEKLTNTQINQALRYILEHQDRLLKPTLDSNQKMLDDLVNVKKSLLELRDSFAQLEKNVTSVKYTNSTTAKYY